MKTLIIGYGSIGKRHTGLLRPMSSMLGIVTAREAAEYPLYRSLDEALADMTPDYIVISTVTAKHAENLAQLKAAGFSGKVLVEKPIFNSMSENDAPYPFEIFVGYHLRFHKVIHAIREAIEGRTIQSASVHVGQHLAQWRPDRDPRETYSAHSDQGGGVMRDLSHELDLAQFLFGKIKEHKGKAERRGNVTVDSEDTARFMLACENCANVTVEMNYLDETARRDWVIETDKGTVKADLIRRVIETDGKVKKIHCDSNAAYRDMHKAVLSDGVGVCRLEEALNIVTIIDAVPSLEHAA